jgi:hypothetical protein
MAASFPLDDEWESSREAKGKVRIRGIHGAGRRPLFQWLSGGRSHPASSGEND